MGKYITDTFARMDLQQIREFLLGDTNYKIPDSNAYCSHFTAFLWGF